MEMPMMHRGHGSELSRMFSVPVPAAMFGLVVSMMFGATVGMIVGKKCAMKGYWGHGKEKMWKAKMGKEMWGKGMMAHHHHEWGGQACTSKHEGDMGGMPMQGQPDMGQMDNPQNMGE